MNGLKYQTVVKMLHCRVA